MNGRRGKLVLVVGPSGAGKDSVLNYAREKLSRDSRFHFPRRVITRAPGSAGEDHTTIDNAGFETLKDGGAFAFHWEAHGLKYGVPKEVELHLALGAVAAINVSRTIIDGARLRFPDCVAAEIHAEPDILAKRIASRGRETVDNVRRRLERAVPAPGFGSNVHRISNDGDLGVAGEAFCDLLRSLAGDPQTERGGAKFRLHAPR